MPDDANAIVCGHALAIACNPRLTLFFSAYLLDLSIKIDKCGANKGYGMNKRKYAGRNASFGKMLLAFTIVVILAAGAGYGLAQYVITPFFTGEDSEISQEKGQEQDFTGSAIIADRVEVETEQTTASPTENTV